MISKELEELRKLMIKLIREVNADKVPLEKASELSKLTAQYCNIVKLQRGRK
jgi:hypothetical protein